MKKITIKNIDENIYMETLDNGMEVYLYVNPKIHNNYVTFTTKYGSIYNEFTIDNKKIKVPNGIAHFLEHKVFVQKEGLQPEEFYAKSGAQANAYTTFKNTSYLFTGPSDLASNIGYLLDFVQNIYLTDENVESEKDIITEEIHMCDDTPSDILYDAIRRSAIKVNPFKESIIGTEKEVRSITRRELLDCYNKFYNPNNMFLVVTGNFDKDEILNVIKENQKKKNFSKVDKIKIKKYNEPDQVVKEYEEIKCNTNIPKVAYSIKIPTNILDIDQRKLSIYLYIIFNLLFGDTSNFDELAKKDGIITNSLFYNILDIDSHFIISLINSSNNYKEIISRIDKAFEKIEIKEEDLERKKKVLISNEIFSYENIEMVNDMIVDNIIFDGKVPDNMVDIIRSLNIQELNSIIKEINFKNKSIVVIKK